MYLRQMSICGYPSLIIVFIIFFLSLTARPDLSWGGTTGKLVGRVIDGETREPMPGVNVIIEGTSLGAATTDDGSFFIINFPAGVYTVSASFLGYRTLAFENVQIVADFTTTQDFQLETTALKGDVITITAERPLIQKDQTSTVKVISSEEIQNLPTRGYKAVVSLQAGVVGYRSGFAVRGGRLGETGYYVDGFSQTDPLTGSSSTVINNNAIDQISLITGGFNAEYGRIMSGVVNVITKRGTRNYEANFEYMTDAVSGDWIETTAYGNTIYNATISGPLIPGRDRILFFASGERRESDDAFPRATADGKLPHNDADGWNWQAKINLDVTKAVKLEMGTLGSTQISNLYVHSFKYNLSHAPKFESNNNSAYVRVTHTINPKAFYKLAVNYFYTERYAGDGVHFKDLPGYGREIPETQTDDEFLFYAEGFLFNRFEHRESSYVGAKGDLIWQYDTHHELKSGFDFELHTLRLYEHLSPRNIYPGSPRPYQDLNVFGYDNSGNSHVDSGLNGAKHPRTIAFYIQDKIEYEGLVINAGLRYDYISPRTEAYVREDEPLGDDSQLDIETDLTGSKVIKKISPRIGVGFPVSDKTVFFFNYGQFFQQPELQNLYVNYDFLQYVIARTPYFFPFGNPNLSHEETNAYELGINTLLHENIRLSIATYYKTTKNLTQVTRTSGRQYFINSFKNRDFGTIKGVDIELKIRRTGNVSGFVNYSLSYAKGTGSSPNTQRNIVFTGSESPKLTSPLAFDQRHNLTVNFDYRIERAGGPVVLGRRILSNAGVNVLISASSGFPYTPTVVFNEVTLGTVTSTPVGPVNSHYGPWVFQVNMKANKRLRLFKFNTNIYVWILNLLNRENTLTVYQSTGQPNTTGWLATVNGQNFIRDFEEEGRQRYISKQEDPTNYLIPRLVRLGLQVSF